MWLPRPKNRHPHGGIDARQRSILVLVSVLAVPVSPAVTTASDPQSASDAGFAPGHEKQKPALPEHEILELKNVDLNQVPATSTWRICP